MSNVHFSPWKLLGWFDPCLAPLPMGTRPYIDATPPSFHVLEGMRDICSYVNRSEATVLDWIRTRAFPATRVDEEWTACRDEVLDWMVKEIWKCN